MNVDLFTGKFWERFDAKIVSGMDDCTIWTGERNTRGYGRVSIERDRKRFRFYAHRLNYERHKGSIPDDKQIDHLCRNTSCVNPDHLEAVSPAENTVRQMAAIHGSDPGVTCKLGHQGEYRRDPKSGKLYCKGCHRERERRVFREAKETQSESR